MVGDGEDRGKTVHLPRLRGFQRLHLIATEIEQVLLIWQPTFTVVEGYAYTRNIGSFVTVVEVGTVIRAVLHKLQLDWVTIPPTVLKKWVTGKGNASKDEMAVRVKEKWGYVSHSDDIVDAYALAQIGQLGEAAVLQLPGAVKG